MYLHLLYSEAFYRSGIFHLWYVCSSSLVSTYVIFLQGDWTSRSWLLWGDTYQVHPLHRVCRDGQSYESWMDLQVWFTTFIALKYTDMHLLTQIHWNVVWHWLFEIRIKIHVCIIYNLGLYKGKYSLTLSYQKGFYLPHP